MISKCQTLHVFICCTQRHSLLHRVFLFQVNTTEISTTPTPSTQEHTSGDITSAHTSSTQEHTAGDVTSARTSSTQEHTAGDVTSARTQATESELNNISATSLSNLNNSAYTQPNLTNSATSQSNLNNSANTLSNPAALQMTDGQTDHQATTWRSARPTQTEVQASPHTPATPGKPNRSSAPCPCRGETKGKLAASQASSSARQGELVRSLRQALRVERSSVSGARRARCSQGDERIAYGVGAGLALLTVAQLLHTAYTVSRHGHAPRTAEKPGPERRRGVKTGRRGGKGPRRPQSTKSPVKDCSV